jgi:DNA primase
MSLVFDHCVDFIPYVHKFDSNEPDYFILDLDAGSEIMKNPKAFDLIKYIASELSSLLTELEVESVVKFSGSRGFQVWASFDNNELKDRGDLFKTYREMAIAIQGKLEDKLQGKIGDLVDMFPNMVYRDRRITTSIVAHKEERASKVLVDWSALKPMGDVRAPFSIHYKTGLASVPIDKGEIMSFDVKDAHPLRVIEDLDRYKRSTKMERCSPSRLL